MTLLWYQQSERMFKIQQFVYTQCKIVLLSWLMFEHVGAKTCSKYFGTVTDLM